MEIFLYILVLSPIIVFTAMVTIDIFRKEKGLRIKVFSSLVFLSLVVSPYFAMHDYNSNYNKPYHFDDNILNDEFE